MRATNRGAHASPARHPFGTDVDKYYRIGFEGDRSLRSRLRLWLLDTDFHVVACFRFGQEARRMYSQSRLLGLLPMVVAGLWRRRGARIHHVTIDQRARIGAGFYVMHRSGIFIGPVVIGDNCVLHHNVTIGQRIAGGDHGVPRIGHDVWIGPGATISGDITIGDGVTISAGSVVSRSIPDGALVAGNPGRVIQADYDNSAMLNYRVARPAGPDAAAVAADAAAEPSQSGALA
jgi:serine O-acetyltransferase